VSQQVLLRERREG